MIIRSLAAAVAAAALLSPALVQAQEEPDVFGACRIEDSGEPAPGAAEACDALLAGEHPPVVKAGAHMARVTLRLDAGDFDGALRDAEAAAGLVPTPDTLGLASRLNLIAGDPQRGLAYADRALELDAQDPWAQAARAESLVELGRAQEALPLLTRLNRSRPDDSFVTALLGRAYYDLDQNARARRVLDEGLRRTPEEPEMLLMRAKVLMDEGETDAARSDLDRALAARPTPAAAVRRAWLRADQGDVGGAKADLAVASNLDGLDTDSLLYYALAAVLVDEAEQAVEAFQHLKAAGAMEPWVQGIYANGLRILGRADEARTEAVEAITADPKTDTAWLTLGAIADDEGDAGAAMNFYRHAVEIEPESYLGNSGLAEAAFSTGDYAQAEKSYTALLALEPTVTTYLSRAAARSYLDDLNGAWKDLDAALALGPDNPDVRVSRGDLHVYVENFDAARAEYDAGLALAPDHADLRLSRAALFRATGQFDAALRDLNAGLAAHPDDQALIAQKGIVYFVMEDPLSAVEWLDKALAANPEDVYALWARSQAKSQLGDAAGAAADMEAAVRLDPSVADLN